MAVESYDTLATIELIKLLKEKGVSFSVRYQLVSESSNGKPEYECIYEIEDTEEFGRLGRSLLVPAKLPVYGSPGRRFNLSPGLVNHHRAYGDGSWICYNPETFEIRCIKDPC